LKTLKNNERRRRQAISLVRPSMDEFVIVSRRRDPLFHRHFCGRTCCWNSIVRQRVERPSLGGCGLIWFPMSHANHLRRVVDAVTQWADRRDALGHDIPSMRQPTARNSSRNIVLAAKANCYYVLLLKQPKVNRLYFPL
jgi:hypothetical protein